LVQLKPARRLRDRHHGALNFEHRLRAQRRDLGAQSGILDHDLGDAPGIAHQREADLGELALMLQPAGDFDPLPDVCAKPV
jgi:hypothetical protein